MKKAKIKNEDVTLNFRVSKELKTKIIRESGQMNLTVSKYLRDVLERVHEGTFCGDGEEIQARSEYLLSRRFLKLAVWIYSKKETDRRIDSDTDEALDEYIKTIKEGDQYLSRKVNYELNKVLADLFRIKVAIGYEKDIFFFTRGFREEKKVNFEVLNNYYLTDSLEVFFNEVWM